MQEQLLVLERELQKIQAPVLEYLNPGVSEEFIWIFFKKFFGGLNVHPDIINLYSWHNGTSLRYDIPGSIFEIMPRCIFSSLGDITDTYDVLRNEYDFLSQGYLPIFTTGDSEYYLINLKDYNSDPLNTQVIFASIINPDLEKHTSIFDSLTQMICTIIQLYQYNVIFISSENHLPNCDFDKYWEISKQMNPNSDYWKR